MFKIILLILKKKCSVSAENNKIFKVNIYSIVIEFYCTFIIFLNYFVSNN